MPKRSKAEKVYTETDMLAVSHNPEWTKEDFAKAKKFDQIMPEAAATIRRRGRNKEPVKVQVSLRLSEEVLNFYKSRGKGWQTRINEDLTQAAKRGRKIG